MNITATNRTAADLLSVLVTFILLDANDLLGYPHKKKCDGHPAKETTFVTKKNNSAIS